MQRSYLSENINPKHRFYHLRQLLAHPFKELRSIQETQQTIQLIIARMNEWPATITNGTIMVVESFYDTAVDEMPEHANTLNSLFYKLTDSHDYSLVKYTVIHFMDFARGLQQIVKMFDKENTPSLLQVMLQRITMLLNKPVITTMLQWHKKKAFQGRRNKVRPVSVGALQT